MTKFYGESQALHISARLIRGVRLIRGAGLIRGAVKYGILLQYSRKSAIQHYVICKVIFLEELYCTVISIYSDAIVWTNKCRVLQGLNEDTKRYIVSKNLMKLITLAAPPFFNPLLDVWISDETLFLVFDILHEIPKTNPKTMCC
jgi:hypothetical protein